MNKVTMGWSVKLVWRSNEQPNPHGEDGGFGVDWVWFSDEDKAKRYAAVEVEFQNKKLKDENHGFTYAAEVVPAALSGEVVLHDERFPAL